MYLLCNLSTFLKYVLFVFFRLVIFCSWKWYMRLSKRQANKIFKKQDLRVKFKKIKNNNKFNVCLIRSVVQNIIIIYSLFLPKSKKNKHFKNRQICYLFVPGNHIWHQTLNFIISKKKQQTGKKF